MRSFVDNRGERWTLEMTFGAFRRLHAAGFDAGDVAEFERLANDPDVSILVLMELCAADLASRGLSQEEFESRFDLDVLGNALQAAAEAIIDFFPEQRRAILRKLMQKVTAQTNSLIDQQLAEIRTRLDSGDLDSRIGKLLSEQLGSVPA